MLEWDNCQKMNQYKSHCIKLSKIKPPDSHSSKAELCSGVGEVEHLDGKVQTAEVAAGSGVAGPGPGETRLSRERQRDPRGAEAFSGGPLGDSTLALVRGPTPDLSV